MIAQLPEWFVLVGRCGGCGHSQHVDRKAVVRRLGKKVMLSDLGPRLTCRQCGNRKDNKVVLSKLPR